MKAHTNNYKNAIHRFGRQIDCKIIYTEDNEEIELGAEKLNSVCPRYEGSILKSVMKELDVDCNEVIPIGTEINCQFGLLVGNSYEYLDFGNYIVYSIEKQEDTRSWRMVCYDKMLNSMKDYEGISNSFPMTLREYATAITTDLGLTFANSSDTFPNYNRVLNYDPYIGEDGTSIGYTYRDIYDEISGATGGTICIDDDDNVEIRYITNINDTIDEEFLKDINVNFGEKFGPVNSIVLSRSAESDNVYLRDEQSVTQNGLCEIKIKDNQLMNGNDRGDYLADLLNVLDGLEYYVNDFNSTGITYYDLCDRYNVSIGNNTYSCVMFNDEINIENGLEELVHTDMPDESETDYSKADKTDRRINQAYIIVDKQRQEINAVVQSLNANINNLSSLVDSQGNEINALGTRINQNLSSIIASVTAIQQELDNGVGLVKTTSVTIDDNGLSVSTDTSKIKTTMTNNTFEITDSGDTKLAYFGYDENEGISKAEMDNLTVQNYFIAGVHRVETIREGGEDRTGYFYIG